MSIKQLRRADASIYHFIETDEGLVLQYGHAKFCLKKSGEIVLQNKHAAITVSAFGEISVQAQADIKIDSAHHIHLNTEKYNVID